jgi:hypothetical protein
LCEPLKFDELSETNVREEVITAFLRALGYRSGTENNVIREQLLRYARALLGRKNPPKDPPLRGKADDILEVHGAVRWVNRLHQALACRLSPGEKSRIGVSEVPLPSDEEVTPWAGS